MEKLLLSLGGLLLLFASIFMIFAGKIFIGLVLFAAWRFVLWFRKSLD